MKNLKIPADFGEAEFTEKRSRFIGNAYYVTSEQEVSETLAALRKKYWDSRHIVHAFVLEDGTARFSDDGEPHGTAGKPVLSVIQGAEVVNCLITVVRYFGGTLLGTGGLVRAYGEAASAALADAGIVETIPIGVYQINCSYDQYQQLVRLIENEGGFDLNSEFLDTVTVEFTLPLCDEEKFTAALVTTFAARLSVQKTAEKMGKK
ncbi:MAG: YigZ family protein [Clostridia bacterium]|nr:YigZ family protein [Clostridia bacterium]